MNSYSFKPFIRENEEKFLSIPELSNGFDPTLPPTGYGLMPVSFYTEKVSFGIYRISLSFTAKREIKQLYVFTGRKQLREIRSMKKGEHFSGSYYQSAAEIIPRYHDQIYPVDHLFFTICTEPGAVQIEDSYAELVKKDFISSSVENQAFRIFLCGDSTVTDHSSELPYHPGSCYAAWGQTLPAFLSGMAAIENQAHCGLTTQDFQREGHFYLVLRHIQKGDICLFQFGHNDQKLSHLWANRQYPKNLLQFVEKIREHGAFPVLVTPLGRNIWDKNGNYLDLLEDHSAAVQHLGSAFDVPVLDLHRWSVSWIKENGMEGSRNYFHPEDYTHTNEYGACLFAKFIAEELANLFPSRLQFEQKIKAFIPPDNLWETLKFHYFPKEKRSRKEQFDQMEKSTSGLLEVIANAKKYSEEIEEKTTILSIKNNTERKD